jgi:hypothetical protein
MVWPIVAALGSAVIGGLSANSAAKKNAAAQRYAADTAAESFRFSKPFIEKSYNQAGSALDASNRMGTYGGQTYAGMNPFEQYGNNYAGNFGMAGAGGAANIMNQGQGFAGNYGNLLNQAQGGNPILDASNYAANNSQPLIDRAMRNDARNLTESTLPGINMGASATNNTNSSRAGMQDALANRGYGDRYADTSARIEDDLRNQYLTQNQRNFGNAMDANRGLGSAYNTGINASGSMIDFMNKAGGNFRGFDQGAISDKERRFNESRDFALDNQIKYQKGILGNADYTSQAYQAPRQSVGSATFGGAMQGLGAGAKAYDMWNDMSNQYKMNRMDAQFPEINPTTRSNSYYQRNT